MATIKAFTDVQQSRKLAEILPFESADMHYCLENRDVVTAYEIGITPFIKAKKFEGKCNIVDVKPAWSLAALLDILPDRTCVYKKTYKDGRIKYQGVAGRIKELILKDNPVDACVAMIEKLHELKML